MKANEYDGVHAMVQHLLQNAPDEVIRGAFEKVCSELPDVSPAGVTLDDYPCELRAYSLNPHTEAQLTLDVLNDISRRLYAATGWDFEIVIHKSDALRSSPFE